MNKFTPREKKFIDEYIKCENPFLAAKNAGYQNSEKKAREILQNTRILREVKRRLSSLAGAGVIKNTYIIDKLNTIISHSLKKTDIYDKQGNCLGKGLKDTSTGLKAIEVMLKLISSKEKVTEIMPEIQYIENLSAENI